MSYNNCVKYQNFKMLITQSKDKTSIKVYEVH